MAFSNPSMIHRSVLHFAQCAGAIQSVAATMRLTGRLGHCVSAAVTAVACQQWLEVRWRTLTPANFTQLQEAQ